MSNGQERAKLHKTIWKIANDLRGSVDGWEFKAYVLGSIFYRFISENICDYIHELMAAAGQPDFNYAATSDAMAENIRQKMVEEKGYFILPSQLFENVAKNADKDENLNETLSDIFRSIESSAVGTPSEDDLRGLFSDFSVDSALLGSTVIKRNQLLAKVLGAVAEMDLGSKYNDTENDTFGDIYEYLMQMYASEAGKSGGEFFTPQQVSELLARLAAWHNPNINKVYDPACGSGSLLLKFAKTVGKDNPDLKYFGQEVNPTTYNLCRINMFLHNVNYDNFDIRLEDTLLKPQHMGDAPFDAIVSNPPYSLKWEGKDNPILINDERYAPAGILAPKKAADLAFTMHMLWHLSEKGTAAIVEFPGVLYRGDAEKKIREYLIKNNFVDTVIQLPPNLFFGPSISTCIIVLKKSAKTDASVLFIDASNLFAKNGNKNILLPEHQDKVMELYQNRKDEQYLAKLVTNDDILKNDCNLSVSSYVEQEDTREVIDITEVNSKLDNLMAEGERLNARIAEIIKEIGDYRDQLLDLEGKPGVEMKTLGEIGECTAGATPSTKISEYWEGGNIPWMSSGEVHQKIVKQTANFITQKGYENASTKMLPVGTIVIALAGQGKTRGSVAITAINLCTNQSLCGVIINDDQIINKYVYYYMSTRYDDLRRISSGDGTRGGLNLKMISSYSVPLPSLAEQERIVSILDTFEASIRNLEAQLKEREKQYEYYRNKLLTFE
jgi:type I restriction enzyme M protein